MSGPIVRKYGFPNFEKIFGPRELKHGVDEQEGHDEAAASDQPAEKASTTQAGTENAPAATTPGETK
jgi:hypothetical protein